MDLAAIVKFLHILGAAVLSGTGIGIALFLVMAHRTRKPALVALVAGTVVVADFLFTATAVILQPVTGLWLAHLVGWRLTEAGSFSRRSPLPTPRLLTPFALRLLDGPARGDVR
jgi:uncharacterized membrane protein